MTAIEAESLEAAVNSTDTHWIQEGYSKHRTVQDIAVNAPYFCYIYKTDRAQQAPYMEILTMQYGGKIYQFNKDAHNEEDLNVFQKMCESIQLE